MLAVMLEAQGVLMLRRLLCVAGGCRGCPPMLTAAALVPLNPLWLAPQRLVQRQAASIRPLPHVLLSPRRMEQHMPAKTWSLLLLLMARWWRSPWQAAKMARAPARQSSPVLPLKQVMLAMQSCSHGGQVLLPAVPRCLKGPSLHLLPLTVQLMWPMGLCKQQARRRVAQHLGTLLDT